jgi:hypothetical protein
MYRLKLSNATDEQIDQIQSPLRQVIAKKAHITAAHTNVLFGGYMECGWKRWRDEAGKERLRILQMAFAKVMRGAVWQLQQDSGTSETSCWNHRLLGMKLQL